MKTQSKTEEPGNLVAFRGTWAAAIETDFIRNDRLSHGARFLWILLKSYAGPDSPRPFPSTFTLRKVMQVARETLGKYGAELIAAGYMAKEQRTGKAGKFSTNLYTLAPQPGLPSPEKQAAVDGVPCTGTALRGVRRGTVQYKSKGTVPTKKKKAPDGASRALADSIYTVYPRRVGRPKAVASILAQMRTFDAAYLLEMTAKFAKLWAGGDLQFCPMPATWFNQQRFKDEPETWSHTIRKDESRPPTKMTSKAATDIRRAFNAEADV
jgi:hypothetical protein